MPPRSGRSWARDSLNRRKPERAKGKGALGIGDVVQHLPDAPFIGRVAVQRFFFGDRREECLFQLILERGKRIVAGYLVDVSEIIRVRLQWSAGGESWLGYRSLSVAIHLACPKAQAERAA